MGIAVLAFAAAVSWSLDAVRDAGVFAGRGKLDSGAWHLVKWAHVISTLFLGAAVYEVGATLLVRGLSPWPVLLALTIPRFVWNAWYWRVAYGKWIDLAEEHNQNAIPEPISWFFGRDEGIALGGWKMALLWLGPSVAAAAALVLNLP